MASDRIFGAGRFDPWRSLAYVASAATQIQTHLFSWRVSCRAKLTFPMLIGGVAAICARIHRSLSDA